MTFKEKRSEEFFSKSFNRIESENFDDCYLEAVGTTGKDPRVELCSFRSAILVRCYFRGVIFINCNFTATKFVDCNFKGAKFIGCTFSYANFRRTIIESSEIIANLPREPSVQRDLLRILRVDARELGNPEDESLYIRKEIAASETFHISAFLGREEWYRKKYGRLERFGFLGKWLGSKALGAIWGNGERPARIVGFCLFLVFIFTIILLFSNGNTNELFTSGDAITLILQSLKLSIAEFLGIPYKPETYTLSVPFWFSALTALLRYLLIGVLVSVLFRAFSRR